MKDFGYKVIPVNPFAEGEMINGEKVIGSLDKISEKIDIVDVFRPSSETSAIAIEAAKIESKVLWLQYGIQNEEAQKIAKKPLTIVGSGNQTRDFLHVNDLTNLILKSAHSKIRGKIYNVAGGKEIKVNKIAKLIGGKKVFIPKRPGEPDRSLADIRKVKKDFNAKIDALSEKKQNELLEI